MLATGDGLRRAVHKQRLEALGKSDSLPPFGSPVHVRTKIYGRAGRYDIENKWRQGIYVGPSRMFNMGIV